MLKPHRMNNFSYKVIHPNIRARLDERSVLNNTVQVAMPFVKLTSTVKLPKILGGSSLGFTLGIQVFDKDFLYEDIYSDRNGNSLIGYTYDANGTGPNQTTTRLIYVDQDPLAAAANAFFDGSDTLYSDENNFNFIPPPGITGMNISLHKNAYVRIADVKFSVPTLQQLEMLHRTFLIPGVGMVLEWGQQFAQEPRNPTISESGLSDDSIRDYTFPWHNRGELDVLLGRLGRNEVGLDEIYENYVIPTQGQYNWMFGRLANFDINSNADGSFDCSAKIVSPNENSWAFGVQSTFVRPNVRREDPICIGDANSIETYFNNTTSGGLNLKTLLEGMHDKSNTALSEWFSHVKFFEKGNKIEGEKEPGNVDEPNTDESMFADSEDAYFVSWRFFVNVILNDDLFGLKAVFKKAGLTDEQLARVSLLRPYKNENGSDTAPNLVDPYENFVGNNKNLRSRDPSTMLIVNERAAVEARNELEAIRQDLDEDTNDVFSLTRITREFLEVGDFHQSARNVNDGLASDDRGFLSTGVWINHKAIIQCMVSSNTAIEGITKLLQRMSSATMNYWNLSIDDNEPVNGDLGTRINYGVVDLNYKENSEYAVQEFLSGGNRVHIFNKYIRNRNGTLVGSDAIDCKVNLSLPRLLFSQIATLGLNQPKDVAEVNNEDPEQENGNPSLPGPNELLRKMFSITSLSSNAGESADGIDPTQPSLDEIRRVNLQSTCGGRNTQTTAGTAGRGNQTGRNNAESSRDGRQDEDELKEQLDKARAQLNDCIRNCQQETPPVPQTITPTPVPPTPVPITPTPTPIPDGNYCTRLPAGSNERFVCDRAYASGITDKVELAQFMAQVGHESNSFRAVSENLNYSEDALNRVFSRYFGSGKENAADYARQPEKIANFVYADENRGSKLGNDQPGDGWKYRGRGYIQLTGKDNYRAVSQAIGRDVVADPDYLTTPEGATDSAVWYWKNRVRPRGVNFADTTQVRRVVNGGTNGLDDTISRFDAYVQRFEISSQDLRVNQPVAGGQSVASSVGRSTFQFNTTREECRNCAGIEAKVQQLEAAVERKGRANQANTRLDTFTKQYAHLSNVFRYIEVFPEWMVARITNNANGNSSNSFGAAPGSLAIKADITIPGIAGLRAGELFWVDRIPAFYRAYGAFIITNLTDSMTRDGWTTNINGVFFYLGDAWKRTMANLLIEGVQ